MSCGLFKLLVRLHLLWAICVGYAQRGVANVGFVSTFSPVATSTRMPTHASFPCRRGGDSVQELQAMTITDIDQDTSAMQQRPCLRRFFAHTLGEAVQRKHVCSLVLTGAVWDAHFKKFVESGVWQRLAELTENATLHAKKATVVANLEVGFILYSGFRGEAALPVGPPFPWDDITIGSYRCDAFRSGMHIGQLPCRTAGLASLGQNSVFDTWVQDILDMCRIVPFSESAPSSSLTDEL